MINAQRLHRQYPETFYVPSYEELEKLKHNDQIKVCMGDTRIWVIVTEVKGKHITCTSDFTGSMKVRFCNVFDTIIY
ncbi:hypothetical protein CIW62_14330 [Enterobacter cloacae]|uniref:hypothetical protein n=1 Tax=Enterobacter cloacae TaxID=550 RepID=UPI0006805ADC|nr:hypothetical protein [Enterobacter cloacae]PAN98972.1 hypothetical protein CIW62_14330 [Enterobacter cloacae]WGV03278.1 hypothetical protein QJS62_16095 [Klebsiella pneumoniae]